MSILGSRTSYKPFEYPWCFDAYKKQQQAHWLPEEVPMAADVADYATLAEPERRVVTQLLKFFVQADIDVGNNYMDHLTQHFHLPEVRMMLSVFGSFESLHAHAYAYLSDSLNLDKDPTFYSAFLNIAAMKEKHDWLGGLKTDDVAGLAKRLAIFGGFVEGVQLFSSFAILNSFPRRNLLKGTGQIIAWSIRDESLHCESISKLFRTIMQENPALWTDELRKDLYDACEKIVELEDAFIDACFELGDIPGLTAADVKRYVRYMANIRLSDLGLKAIFKGVEENPFPWLETMIRGVEHSNFFEQRGTSYAKGLITDDLPREVFLTIHPGDTK